MKLIITFFCIFCLNVFFAQRIDNDFSNYKEIRSILNVTNKRVKINKSDSVIAFESCRTPINDNYWGYRYTVLPNYTFSDSTLLIDQGTSTVPNWKKGKTMYVISFRIADMPEINDTASFKFTYFNGTINGMLFSPKVYLSKRLMTWKKKKPLNYVFFDYYGKLCKPSKNPLIEDTILKYKITKKFKKYTWIHLISDQFPRVDGGIISSNANYKLKTKLDEIDATTIEFNLLNNSLFPSSLDLLKSKVRGVEKEIKITISSFYPIKGNMNHNLMISYIRLQYIKELLLLQGVLEKNIILLTPIRIDSDDESIMRKINIEVN